MRTRSTCNHVGMAKPRAVLLTGTPGSGKSTLGHKLAQELRVPFISRDHIRGGLLFSEGAWTDKLGHFPTGDEAVEIFLATVEGLLENGVSCVIEYVVREKRPQDLERITSLSDCVVIMTQCADAMQRARKRNLTDRLISNKAVLDALGMTSVEEHTDAFVIRMHAVQTEMRQDFPLPLLEVDTSASYTPSIEAILAFVTS